MDLPTVQYPEKSVWAIAARDHDVIARRELLALGYSKHAIVHRLRIGKLHRKARGVYAVGSPNLTKYGRLMVAIKSCGDGSVLSHLSAAVLWGLWKWEPSQIQVTVPATRNPRPDGVSVFRRDLKPGSTTTQRRIPVTTPLQTLVDCAPNRSRQQVERMINQADALDLVRADVLREELEGRTEPGAVMVRGILDEHSFVLSDSVLEQFFVPIAVRVGLGAPETQVWVNGWKVDFWFRELNLVVECDSLRYHRTQIEQKNDRLRDQAHAAAGTTAVRFTHWQIAKEAGYVGENLAAVRERLRPRARTPGRPRAA